VVCGELTHDGTRCAEHRRQRYGRRHRAARLYWAGIVGYGTTYCSRCGEVIIPGTDWQLDHRPGGSHPSHLSCNQRAAARGLA
jgi:hypothetical protein